MCSRTCSASDYTPQFPASVPRMQGAEAGAGAVGCDERVPAASRWGSGEHLDAAPVADAGRGGGFLPGRCDGPGRGARGAPEDQRGRVARRAGIHGRHTSSPARAGAPPASPGVPERVALAPVPAIHWLWRWQARPLLDAGGLVRRSAVARRGRGTRASPRHGGPPAGPRARAARGIGHGGGPRGGHPRRLLGPRSIRHRGGRTAIPAPQLPRRGPVHPRRLRAIRWRRRAGAQAPGSVPAEPECAGEHQGLGHGPPPSAAADKRRGRVATGGPGGQGVQCGRGCRQGDGPAALGGRALRRGPAARDARAVHHAVHVAVCGWPCSRVPGVCPAQCTHVRQRPADHAVLGAGGGQRRGARAGRRAGGGSGDDAGARSREGLPDQQDRQRDAINAQVLPRGAAQLRGHDRGAAALQGGAGESKTTACDGDRAGGGGGCGARALAEQQPRPRVAGLQRRCGRARGWGRQAGHAVGVNVGAQQPGGLYGYRGGRRCQRRQRQRSRVPRGGARPPDVPGDAASGSVGRKRPAVGGAGGRCRGWAARRPPGCQGAPRQSPIELRRARLRPFFAGCSATSTTPRTMHSSHALHQHQQRISSLRFAAAL